jgi:hypothetical protein
MERGKWRRNLGWTTCVVALVALASTAPAAQDKPDFSGRWILETRAPSGADVPRTLTIRQSLVRTNVRGEPIKPFFKDITLEREFASGTRSETLWIGVVGGIVPGLREDGSPDGAKVHTAVMWEDHTLAIERGSHTGPNPETGVWTERREVWSLEHDGRLRVAITTRGSGNGAKTVTLVYRRQ